MLGRRQIREKIIQTLYAYQQNPINYAVLEKNMLTEFDKIYHLYVYQLQFLLALRKIAENQIEISKTKFIKTQENLNPNTKFVQNPILLQLEENQELSSFINKHKNLSWDIHDDLLIRTYQKLKSSKLFQEYMNQKETSFGEEQKFIGKVFLRYIAENESLHQHLESIELSWSNDLHISNSMIQKTIGHLKENENTHTLLKVFKDEQDLFFAKKLLIEALNHWESTEEKLKERLENWNLERVALMDKIILVTALTELDHFPLTPTKIIINEYIEIAKAFATDKSQIFVNGILDRYTKNINRN